MPSAWVPPAGLHYRACADPRHARRATTHEGGPYGDRGVYRTGLGGRGAFGTPAAGRRPSRAPDPRAAPGGAAGVGRRPATAISGRADRRRDRTAQRRRGARVTAIRLLRALSHQSQGARALSRSLCHQRRERRPAGFRAVAGSDRPASRAAAGLGARHRREPDAPRAVRAAAQAGESAGCAHQSPDQPPQAVLSRRRSTGSATSIRPRAATCSPGGRRSRRYNAPAPAPCASSTARTTAGRPT